MPSQQREEEGQTVHGQPVWPEVGRRFMTFLREQLPGVEPVPENVYPPVENQATVEEYEGKYLPMDPDEAVRVKIVSESPQVVVTKSAVSLATFRFNIPSAQPAGGHAGGATAPLLILGADPRRRAVTLVNKSATAIDIAIGTDSRLTLANNAHLAQNDSITLPTGDQVWALAASGTGILDAWVTSDSDSS